MSKPIIQNIDQLSANETAAIDLLNRNYDKLREFIELAVFRDGSTPSEMLADLDMNSKRIINLAEPTSDNQAVRLADLKKYIVEYNNLIEEINAAIDKAYDTIESEGHKQIEALQTLSAQLQAQLLEAVNQGKDVLKRYVEDTLIPELEGFDSDAEKYAVNAKDWAVKMDGKVTDPDTVTEVDYSSKYYADLSRQSADASEASAVLAENQANQAGEHQLQAREYRDQAESEKRTAVEASMSAAESKKDANMWALDAQDYKNLAQTYATNAAASAKDAANQVTGASGWATTARQAATEARAAEASAETFATQAQQSSTSAEDAATHANEAVTQATEAVKNARDAQTAAESAESSAADFAMEAQSYVEESKKWAIGTSEERPEGSSKSWAEKAEEAASKIVDENLVHIDKAETITAPKTLKVGQLADTLIIEKGASLEEGSNRIKFIADETNGNDPLGAIEAYRSGTDNRFRQVIRLASFFNGEIGAKLNIVSDKRTGSLIHYADLYDTEETAWNSNTFRVINSKYLWGAVKNSGSFFSRFSKQGNTSSGYCVLGNGFILQWGIKVKNVKSLTVTWPIAWSGTTTYGVSAIYAASSQKNALSLVARSATTSTFYSEDTGSSNVFFMGIGY